MSIKLIKRINAGKKDAKNILVIGVFHGDEEQGEYLINKYLESDFNCNFRKEYKGKNNVYYIPRLNSEKTRVNKNGVDLNRNFPTKNWGEDTSLAGENPADYFGGKRPNSEKETQFIVSMMEKIDFSAVITLHSPYEIVNYDGDRNGEALKLAEKVSEITGYPVQKDIGYPTPGSFGTYAGIERDIPVITIEMDENTPLTKLYLRFAKLFDFLENFY